MPSERAPQDPEASGPRPFSGLYDGLSRYVAPVWTVAAVVLGALVAIAAFDLIPPAPPEADSVAGAAELTAVGPDDETDRSHCLLYTSPSPRDA